MRLNLFVLGILVEPAGALAVAGMD